MNKHERVIALRDSGAVKRCHVMRTVGDYTVGQHSYDALSILLVLHPDPSIDLVRAVLWHDAAERTTGDIPGPTKRRMGVLAEEIDEAEYRVLAEMLDQDPPLPQTCGDANWLGAVDLIEFYLWCRDQLSLGNTYASDAYSEIRNAIYTCEDTWPKEAWDFFVAVDQGHVTSTHRWRKLGEVL